MRRTAICSGFMALVTILTSVTNANDIQIAQHIAAQLRAQKQAQALKGFHIGIKVESGKVSMSGQVSSAQQRDLAINIARRAPDVTLVVNELQVIQAPSAPAVGMPSATTASGLATVAAPLQQPPSAGFSPQPATPIMGVSGDEALSGELYTATTGVPASGQEPAVQAAMPLAQPVSVVSASPQMPPAANYAATMTAPAEMVTPSAQQVAWGNVQQPTGSGVQQFVPQHIAISGVVQQPVAQSQVPTLHVRPQQQVQNAVPAIPQGFASYASENQQVRIPQPIARMANAPNMGQPVQAMPADSYESYESNASVASGTPVPISHAAHAHAGHGGNVGYDQPTMPNHAWPSYAAYPNYAGVTYPRQYSPTAWPYIGPFYPYPQVPLGWRKVTLEWDDGWWWLDFNSK